MLFYFNGLWQLTSMYVWRVRRLYEKYILIESKNTDIDTTISLHFHSSETSIIIDISELWKCNEILVSISVDLHSSNLPLDLIML